MENKSVLSSQLKKLLMSISVLALSAVSVSAQAAQFGVRVVDGNGAPIAGASVCIGMQGNYKQFGATFTDQQGYVSVDVPNVPLLVTVSKDRFTGMRTTEPARSFNLLKEVKLREGTPGPRCRAGSVLTEHKPGVGSIVVTDIAIDDGAFSKTLSPTVSGEPNQYRVGSSKDLEGVQWQRFSNRIALGGELSEEEKVYLQMRKFAGNSKAFLESRSEVMTIRLN